MMKLNQHILPAFVLSLTLLFASCKPDPDPPFECPDIWSFVNSQQGDYTFADSKLSFDLNDSTQAGAAMMLIQDSLRGDFTIGLAYEALDTGDTGLGAFLQLMIGNGSTSTPFTCKAATGNVSPGGAGLQVGAIIDSTGLNPGGSGLDWSPTTGTSGILTISRTGNQVTATATAGGVTASQTRGFNSQACAVVIQLGSNYETLLGHVGVRFTTFTVSGGGTEVVDDDFGCDSFF